LPVHSFWMLLAPHVQLGHPSKILVGSPRDTFTTVPHRTRSGEPFE
jgi:hypothetical protein